MPNLRGKTWTTTTPANVEDAQYWEDHLISDADAAKIGTVILPTGGTAGQVLTKQSSTANDATWEDPASSGHTIVDEDDTDMPYRTNLQFLNADVTDDSANDATVVDCKGSKGDPGQAATVEVGTTSTLNPGSSATVTNSGTTSAAVFNFGIPRGADGTDGTDGEDGVSVTGVQLLSTSGRVKTYRMSFSNGTYFDYDVTDGADGSGAGDMLKSDYDANSAVYNAGGIAAYVAGQAYSLPTASSSTLGGVKVGTNLSISDGVLSATNTDSLSGLTDTSISIPSAGQVLKYNATSSKWENADQSAGGGSTIVVSTVESSLIGTTATITDGTTTLTATFASNGKATFTGVTLTGNLTLTYTDGTSTGTQTISIPYFGNYAFSVSFFSATITVTYPAALGATCSITDGTTTINATGSPMVFNIPNAGTWTATAILDGVSKAGTAISITTDGQTASDTIAYGTINLTFDDDFRGQTITCVNGGTTITKSAPSSGNTMSFYPPTTGSWTISGMVSGDTYYSTPNPVVVSSLSTSVSASLESLPNGSTVTPTDDIQTWLKCAGIRDKTTYTTLADVLADTDTFIALCADSNACDYMARSTTWASGVTADATAMQIVGKYGYCAKALRDDNTWNTAINNSPHASYVPVSPVVPTGTVIHSAVEDTTYYMEGGQSVPFCTIASGDTETVLASTIESLKNQTITLYSSVAKDPTNLSNDYSKSIRITPNITEIYLMPDFDVIYWWGSISSSLKECSTANGWSGVTYYTPTYNSNDIQTATSGSGKGSGVYFTPTSAKTLKAIAKGVTAQDNEYGFYFTTPNKDARNSSSNTKTVTSNSLALITGVTVANNNSVFWAQGNRSCKWSAIWIE